MVPLAGAGVQESGRHPRGREQGGHDRQRPPRIPQRRQLPCEPFIYRETYADRRLRELQPAVGDIDISTTGRRPNGASRGLRGKIAAGRRRGSTPYGPTTSTRKLAAALARAYNNYLADYCRADAAGSWRHRAAAAAECLRRPSRSCGVPAGRGFVAGAQTRRGRRGPYAVGRTSLRGFVLGLPCRRGNRSRCRGSVTAAELGAVSRSMRATPACAGSRSVTTTVDLELCRARMMSHCLADNRAGRFPTYGGPMWSVPGHRHPDD